jgi:hypothetical protein
MPQRPTKVKDRPPSTPATPAPSAGRTEHQTTSTRRALSERTARLLWVVAVLDMMAVAWMIAAGDWLDQQTSGFAEVITLGGNHRLVLILAAAGFLMLAGLAMVTDGFSFASRLEIALLTVAGTISVVALAGALSAILLLGAAALLLGFAGRLLFRP